MGIERQAIPSEVHNAYDFLSKKCHPEQGSYDPNELPIKTLSQSEYWQALNEAYEVLSDSTLRYIFDLYGMHGLQTGVCLSGWQTSAYTFSGDCMKIYSNFLANKESLLSKTIIPKTEPIETMNNYEPPHVLHTVMVTLEELFYGTKKIVHYNRNIVQNGSIISCVKDWCTEVNIPPGTLHGTHLIKTGVGDIVDDTARDSLFVVFQLPHFTFRTSGHDLIISRSVSLKLALLGGPLPIQTIDGKTLVIIMKPIADNTLVPGQQYNAVLIKGQGMPIPNTNRRGNMVVQIQVTENLFFSIER
ncbi:dnaJ homolog subfamily B member 5 [Anopheles coustani]|uniref:dnaJ homolog subfamily B member 5 n=1 Tax=Anopheles coustani TaxID=139045 RepID=UPI00265A32A6|nr:dnaJ homolog subfamily B member 5 [Anopheles coustani]